MRCPWCGQPERKPSVYDLVVAGEDDSKAPRLAHAWLVTSCLMRLRQYEEPALEFGKALADATNVSESSIRNLILAGQRAGLIEVHHRVGGTPRRSRAYVRWSL